MVEGITPARAGNSFHQLHLNREFGDHPRACGEQYLLISSPPASPWITPARAGNSRMYARIETGWWDHPRACGEQRRGWWRRNII